MKAEFAKTHQSFDAVNQRLDVLSAEVARKADGAAMVALEYRVTALERRVGVQ